MKIFRDFILPILVALAIYGLLQLTVGSFRVYGVSMLPTIQPNEYIMVNKAAYFVQQPQRGDIVVLHSPREPGIDLIKRIIGLPGDTVEVKEQRVFVNGTPLNEPYIAESPNYALPPKQIPPEQYFVLGDNRNHSLDSHIGWTAPRQNIVGKAWITYWPPHMWRAIKNHSLLVNIRRVGLNEQIAIFVTPCPKK